MRGAGVVLLALLVLGPALAARPAAAGVADRVGATFALMLEDIVAALAPVEGVVVAVEDGVLYVDVGADRGARVGQEYTVFRRGEEFRHPLTGQPLGRHEDVLGHARLTRVEPRFAEAVFLSRPDVSRPRVEDGVRITRGRLKVAVTPPLDLTTIRPDLRRVPFLLAVALERTRRFQVVDPLAVTDMFAGREASVEEMLARPERAVRIARNLEVAAWVVPIVLERRGTLYLDVTLISAVSGSPIVSRRRPLEPPEAAEAQRFPWEPRATD